MALQMNDEAIDRRKWASDRKSQMVAWMPAGTTKPVRARIVQVNPEICFIKVNGTQPRTKARFADLYDLSEVAHLMIEQKPVKKELTQQQIVIVTETQTQQPQIQPLEPAMESATQNAPQSGFVPTDTRTGWYIIDVTTKKLWAGGSYGFQPFNRFVQHKPMVRWGSIVNQAQNLIASTDQQKHRGKYDPAGIKVVTVHQLETLIATNTLPGEVNIGGAPAETSVTHPAIFVPRSLIVDESNVMQGVHLPQAVLNARKAENLSFQELMTLRTRRMDLEAQVQEAKRFLQDIILLEMQIVETQTAWETRRQETVQVVLSSVTTTKVTESDIGPVEPTNEMDGQVETALIVDELKELNSEQQENGDQQEKDLIVLVGSQTQHGQLVSTA